MKANVTPNDARQNNLPVMLWKDQVCVLKGDWVVAAFSGRRQVDTLRKQLQKAVHKSAGWDLCEVRLDHIGAELLWRAWGKQLPANIKLGSGQSDLFKKLQAYRVDDRALESPMPQYGLVAAIGYRVFDLIKHLSGLTQLLGQFFLDALYIIANPLRIPWKDLYGQLLRMGAQALPITGLVGLLIGVVIVYLLGGFLKSLGAGDFIIPLVGVASIRELGPLIGAILVAGRSGSTITAQIGVMRLREELDAMHVLGIPVTLRLVWPRVTALTLTMPFVTMWTSILMIVGGMVSANISVDISYAQFVQNLPKAVSFGSIWINLVKSAIFGFLIAMIGCHFGLRIKSDTESLGNGTTASVVASITAVILADALIAILCRNIPA